MALGVTAYTEAPFGAEDSNVIVYPSGIQLTMQENTPAISIDVNVSPTGQSLTTTSGSAIGSSFVQVNLTGSNLSTNLGDTSESFTDVDVNITGQELTVVNESFFQDTLVAFSEAPFATQSPQTISPPNINVITGNADVIPISLSLSSNLGTANLDARTEVFPNGFDLTMQENAPDDVTGDANISLTGFALSASLGTAVLDANTLVDITGQELTMQEGQATADDASAEVTGISFSISQGSVKNIMWSEVNTGTIQPWTEVDTAA